MYGDYRYVVTFHRPGRRSILAQAPLNVDWGPAEECVRLAALRRGHGPLQALPMGEVCIEPVWHKQKGQPCLAGVRAGIELDDEWIVEDLEVEYFLPAIAKAGARLIKSGGLRSDDEFHVQVNAFRRSIQDPDCNTPAAPNRERELCPIPVQPGDFEALLKTSSPLWMNDPGDVPVFVPAEVLDEIEQRTRSVCPAVTGGILIGQMRRDPLDAEMLFLTVTAQVPAPYRTATPDRFTFTPETWAAANSAVRIRGRGEICCGWWHCGTGSSFPSYPPRREMGGLNDPYQFFGESACALHRLVFPRAFSIGLVATRIEDDVWMSCFGWRKGRILRRGLRILDACRAYEPRGASRRRGGVAT